MTADLPPIDTPQPPNSGAALRSYALAELDRCMTQLGRAGEARHTGIHQARKSLRRTRAALALADSRLGSKAEKLGMRLRRLCRSLCALRDSHAVLDTLKRWNASLDAPQRKALRGAVTAARRSLKDQRDALLAQRLESDPEFVRLRDRVANCRARIEALPWERLRGKHLASGLARSQRRIDRSARRAKRRDDVEDFHRWRRRLRRLRQQLTALDSSGLSVSVDVLPDPAVLESLAWRQDLDVLEQSVARLSSLDPALRRQLSLALRPDAVESGEYGSGQ